MNVQSGFAARALSVRQMPPPETPAQTRQPEFPQLGETTSAVVRLAVLFVAPEKARTPGWVAFTCGPSCAQLWPLPFGSPALASFIAIFANVFSAFALIAGGMTLAGYVRWADR